MNRPIQAEPVLVPGVARTTAGWRRLRPQDVQIYRICEDVTGLLICGMVIFSPWAFGTTQTWAIWTMNIAGYLLGLMLACKLVVRNLKGYQPSRWEIKQSKPGVHEHNGRPKPSVDDTSLPASSEGEKGGRRHRSEEIRKLVRRKRSRDLGQLTRALIVLTFAVLGFCLVSVLNARSSYHPQQLNFTYYQNTIRWLPSSLDSGRTWKVFWNYLALACAFWALWDWLLGKTSEEEKAERQAAAQRATTSREGVTQAETHHESRASRALGREPFPARLRQLFWVLSINGGLLAIESIVQRLSGSDKLLFLVQPHVNVEGETQFGPYAYRGNAAQYFNLLWPACLGFWWTLEQAGEFRRKLPKLLLFCVVLMATAAIVSTSRGGAMITVGIFGAGIIGLFSAQFVFPPGRDVRRGSRVALRWLIGCGLVALVLGFALGWKQLSPRLGGIAAGFEGRELMSERARPMADDYAWYGTGPGTFETVFQLYRFSTDVYWPAQLHNDWLETRITFGCVGSLLIWTALLLVLLRWFWRGGFHAGGRFMLLTWLAVAGVLTHARYDFPFQIYSLVFLFLVICAVLFNLSHKP